MLPLLVIRSFIQRLAYTRHTGEVRCMEVKTELQLWFYHQIAT